MIAQAALRVSYSHYIAELPLPYSRDLIIDLNNMIDVPGIIARSGKRGNYHMGLPREEAEASFGRVCCHSLLLKLTLLTSDSRFELMKASSSHFEAVLGAES